MSSSASQVSDLSPEASQIMDYDQFWRENNNYGTISPSDQFFVKILNAFTGEGKRVKDAYEAYKENYLNNLNMKNERKAVQSARSWDEYMSNTAYSRAFKDLEGLGINPYLLLNNGSTPSTSVGSSSKPDYRSSGKSNQESTSSVKGRDLALIMIGIARLIAAL